jgi:hypothetical protein
LAKQHLIKCIMTLRRATLSRVTLSIVTLSTATQNIMALNMPTLIEFSRAAYAI